MPRPFRVFASRSKSGVQHFKLSKMGLEATGGRAVTLQTSSNLQDWRELQTYIHPGGIAEVLDPDADSGGTRFYRVAVP